MPTLALPISRIEDALADRGMETRLYVGDDSTAFIIASGSRELEILDAVSGHYYKPDHLTEAILYGVTTEDATARFESVESVEEFLAAVAEILS